MKLGNAALTRVTTSLRQMLGGARPGPSTGLIAWRGLEALGILATLWAALLAVDANRQAAGANNVAADQLKLAQDALADQRNIGALTLLASGAMPREMAWSSAASLVNAGIGVPALDANCRPGEVIDSDDFGDVCTKVSGLKIIGPGDQPVSLFDLAADNGRLTGVVIENVAFWGGTMQSALIMDSPMVKVSFSNVSLAGTNFYWDTAEPIPDASGTAGPSFEGSDLEAFMLSGDGYGTVAINNSNVTNISMTRVKVSNGSFGNYWYVPEGDAPPASVPFYVTEICPASARPSTGWKPDLAKCQSPEDLGLTIEPTEDAV